MKSAKSIKNGYKAGSWCRSVFGYCQTRFVILCIIYLLAIILGFIILGQFGGDLTEDNIIDSAMLAFLQGDCNCFAMFLRYFIIMVPLMCYAMFLNRNLFLVIINICIVVVIGYMFSYHMTIFCNIFSTLAFIVLIIIMPVFSIAIMLCYMIIIATSWSRMVELKKYGKICNCEQDDNIKSLYIILSVAIVVLLFVYCLLLNILRVMVCI